MAFEYVAPLEFLDDDVLRAFRSYLDGQRRIRGAYWVAVRFAPDGAIQHGVHLDIGDQQLSGGDAAAFLQGLSLELAGVGISSIHLTVPDELVELRAHSTVIWEARANPAPDLDALDFALRYEPIALPEQVAQRVADHAAGSPTIECVRLSRERLVKGESEVWSRPYLYVRMDRVELTFAEQVRPLQELIRPHLDSNRFGAGTSCVDPEFDKHSTLLYERSAESA